MYYFVIQAVSVISLADTNILFAILVCVEQTSSTYKHVVVMYTSGENYYRPDLLTWMTLWLVMTYNETGSQAAQQYSIKP